ncbi:MAG: DUF1853 family protein [Eudoraea sp.]|nr:DUF1853 family protein [Eudoraea sp.]
MVTLTTKILKAFIGTPPLWPDRQFGLKQFVFPVIDVDKVHNSNVPANMRLGHKMEHVFKNCLQGQVIYDLLAHNVTVKRNKRTIGEIDFLLKDKRDGRILHLELTYKFYLIDTTLGKPLYQLIGPNRRDKFHSKLEKLKNTQFQIPFLEEGKEQLALLDVKSEDIKQEVCFKAQLFTPYDHSEVVYKPFNKLCISGFWLSFEAFDTIKFQEYEYYVPTKDEWAVSPYNKEFWISHSELLLELKSLLYRKRSPLVWMKKEESVFEKFFVVWW